MRYTSVFTVSYNADDDQTARRIAHLHHQQLLDQLRVEGADHPYEFTLERVVAQDPNGPRDIARTDQERV